MRDCVSLCFCFEFYFSFLFIWKLSLCWFFSTRIYILVTGYHFRCYFFFSSALQHDVLLTIYRCFGAKAQWTPIHRETIIIAEKEKKCQTKINIKGRRTQKKMELGSINIKVQSAHSSKNKRIVHIENIKEGCVEQSFYLLSFLYFFFLYSLLLLLKATHLRFEMCVRILYGNK